MGIFEGSCFASCDNDFRWKDTSLSRLLSVLPRDLRGFVVREAELRRPPVPKPELGNENPIRLTVEAD